ncbi:MAG: hypothetical protein UX53_C0018G0015 [Candidatus Azambacteria bacterium GW2011_GWB2_46_37]|uniref:Uncharacterized protein n=1 Tax=Candidatus Azambacteria bacterium GW2011_GWB2_46_37 TaxID=1618618 RepID=A0A0G1Q1V3_9BACT|nr:MAG: hypothetical protein UX53_C0018G0015 [Candidatus Azambacteria bacterium GW2011_GWB2_46_37]
MVADSLSQRQRRVFFSLHHKNFFQRLSRLHYEIKQTVLVRVRRVSAYRPNLRSDRHRLVKNFYLFGFFQNPAAKGPGNLIADY